VFLTDTTALFNTVITRAYHCAAATSPTPPSTARPPEARRPSRAAAAAGAGAGTLGIPPAAHQVCLLGLLSIVFPNHVVVFCLSCRLRFYTRRLFLYYLMLFCGAGDGGRKGKGGGPGDGGCTILFAGTRVLHFTRYTL
jgi:hypothetical protein